MSCQIINAKLEDWSPTYDGLKFHAVLCDPPYGLEFMGKEFDTFKGRDVDPAFMHWFAGFIDGEGCFSIHKKPQDTYDCQFHITLRGDDKPILQRIQRQLGLGTIADRPETDKHCPQVRYSVSSKADCVRLRDLLRAFPLRAKKAADFELWSDALDAWLSHEKGEWGDMAAIRDNLMASREYEPEGVRVDPYQMAAFRWAKALMPHLFPGALVLVFGGTRTWHRLAAGFEDAGFEIWDTLMWLHGQGFPKAQDISKLIDKANGDEREVASQKRFKSGGTEYINRNNVVQGFRPNEYQKGENVVDVTAPGSDLSAPWSGYKTTALKPAWEPVLCFKKPLTGTYAEMAQKYGSGALNVDGGRITVDDDQYSRNCSGDRGHADNRKRQMDFGQGAGSASGLGRYPANVILDEESAALLDEQTGNDLTSGTSPKRRNSDKTNGIYGDFTGQECTPYREQNTGGASRFFYTAKASSAERNAGLEGFEVKHVTCRPLSDDAKREKLQERMHGRTARNHHPTVKPIDLCRYLATLILPPDSMKPRRLLVPFAGSGSEMIGAIRAGWDEVLGVEQDAAYCELSPARIVGDAPLFNTVEVGK